jgi:MFS family permease
VIASRFLFLLGLYPVQRFVLFVLEDRYEVEEPLARASVFILLAIVVAAAFGWAAGKAAEKVTTDSLLTASVVAGTLGLVGIAFAPNLWVLAIGGMALAGAAGAFQALTWALLSKCLRDEQAAQYFGVANIATAGAGALAGAFGPLVDVLQVFVPGATYQVLFGICALITATSVAPLRGRPNSCVC